MACRHDLAKTIIRQDQPHSSTGTRVYTEGPRFLWRHLRGIGPGTARAFHSSGPDVRMASGPSGFWAGHRSRNTSLKQALGTVTTAIPAPGMGRSGQFYRMRRWRDENRAEASGMQNETIVRARPGSLCPCPGSPVPQECAGSQTQPHTSAAITLWGQGDPGPEESRDATPRGAPAPIPRSAVRGDPCDRRAGRGARRGCSPSRSSEGSANPLRGQLPSSAGNRGASGGRLWLEPSIPSPV